MLSSFHASKVAEDQMEAELAPEYCAPCCCSFRPPRPWPSLIGFAVALYPISFQEFLHKASSGILVKGC